MKSKRAYERLITLNNDVEISEKDLKEYMPGPPKYRP